MNKTESDFAVEAVYKIKTNPQCTIAETYETLTWFENNDEDKPTEAEFNTALASVKAEFDAQEYARKRQAEYPSMGDQLDMIYKDMKNGTSTHADAVEVVKTKYPKG